MGYTRAYYKTRNETLRYQGSNINTTNLNIKDLSNNAITAMYSTQVGPLGNKMSTSQPSTGTTSMSSSPFSNTDTFIQLGTGNTAESVDDYKLDTPLTTGYYISSANSATEIDTELHATVRTITATIVPSSNFTAKEIGLFERICTSYSQSSYAMSPAILMYRKVFDTPIEFVSGVAKTIEIKIVYDAPTA